ncbi:MAG: class II glutamine amidotransferase [Streptosporangiaceae bacterium]|nr:class II glutamine amidotransferase [Streptosporangiaceae bacterium]
MCRLFGLTSGPARVHATFWLLDAPDSLEAQSHRNADGSGIGFFGPAGEPVLDKQPEPAFSDQEFIHEAREAQSSVFVAHVRWASAGGRTVRNTHPFAMRGRIMAHNGGFGDLQRLDSQLGGYASLVGGETDSERYFALITQQIDVHDGDVGAGITAAASWIAAHLPVSALNTVVAAPGELWALRYPGQHALHILERPAGPGSPAGKVGLHVRSATSSVHVPAAADVPSVVVASEQLDGESGWRMLAPGELVHVRSDLSVESAVVITRPPVRLVPVPAGNPNIDT